jgi:hypothetical protein
MESNETENILAAKTLLQTQNELLVYENDVRKLENLKFNRNDLLQPFVSFSIILLLFWSYLYLDIKNPETKTWQLCGIAVTIFSPWLSLVLHLRRIHKRIDILAKHFLKMQPQNNP